MRVPWRRKWVTSSLSYGNGQCLEVTGLDTGKIRLRDSKHPEEGVLKFTPAAWDEFLKGVAAEEFNRKF
jgi:hypothetical protein